MTAFAPGLNIAMKLPERHFEATKAFYRNTLGLDVTDVSSGAKVAFGGVTLWLDRVPHQSQTDLWLEVRAPDVAAARRHLESAGVATCDEVEQLPDDFDGFWIAAPSGTIHLVCGEKTEGP